MNQGGYGDNSYRMNAGKLRMAVTAELLRAIRDMQHVDELFHWLTLQIVQRFGVQVVQIWVAQIDFQGQYVMKLQALSSQDNSLPHRVALSKPFADLAGEIRSWQTELALSLIGNVFSSSVMACITASPITSTVKGILLRRVLVLRAKPHSSPWKP